jgi:hypothetical protein
MRVKVVRTYVDKYTHFRHIKDTEVEMTRGRFDEIALSGHFVEEIKEAAKLV